MDGHADLAPKRLQLLKTAAPLASRVAALLNPTSAHAKRQLDHLRRRPHHSRSDLEVRAGGTPRGVAMKHRLPAIGTRREFAEAGMLMSYGTNFAEQWRRSATYVDKILKGAKPGDLPIEHPTKFELFANARTAKALRISVPPRFSSGRTT